MKQLPLILHNAFQFNTFELVSKVITQEGASCSRHGLAGYPGGPGSFLLPLFSFSSKENLTTTPIRSQSQAERELSKSFGLTPGVYFDAFHFGNCEKFGVGAGVQIGYHAKGGGDHPGLSFDCKLGSQKLSDRYICVLSDRYKSSYDQFLVGQTTFQNQAPSGFCSNLFFGVFFAYVNV